jgi:hypothetical protein
MAIYGTTSDFEVQKFVESPTRPGMAAVEVTGTLDVEIPPVVGGATEAKQDEEIALLESIDLKLDGPIDVNVEFPLVQPISADALPLPNGAATEAKQDDELAQLTNIASSAAALETIYLNPFQAPPTTDYIGRSVASDVVTWLYKNGGSGGTLLKTVTVTYTDATLETILTLEVS